MLDSLLLVSIGISLTIFLGFLKKKRRAPLVYWSVLILLGLGLIYTPHLTPSVVIILPFCLRGMLNFLFAGNDSIQLRRVSYLPIVLLLYIGFHYIDLGGYFLSLALTIEVYITINHYRRYQQKKGISLASNTGLKAWWVFGFTTLNILLIGTILISTWVTFFYLIAQLSLISIGLLTVLTFLREDIFGSLFAVPKYEKSSIEAAEKYRIGLAIDQVIREGTFHKSFDASLGKLAQLVKSTTHQVSQVINESKGMSFGELVAYHRVKDAKKMLLDKKKKHLSIEGIASDVGYASKAAFNKAFKKFTGISPSKYRDSSVLADQGVPLQHSEKPINREGTATFEAIKNARIMLSNFLKVYFRNQLKNKPLSLINLLGLTLGITSTILITIYLQFETSFDTFHSDHELIHRVVWESENAQTRTPHPMAQALVEDFPNVESAVSISPVYGPGLTLQSIYVRNPENETMFQEKDVFFADSTFFDVFDFKLIRGERKSVLDEPGKIVISSTLATKYFGDEDPIGKRLEFVAYDFIAEVAGVMEDTPENSHFHPQVLISYMSRKYRDPDDFWMTWGDFGHFNYLKLTKGTDPLSIENELSDWVTQYRDFTDDQLSDMRSKRSYFRIQPINEIHLHSDLRWELESNGNIIYVYILSAAIVFLILISVINYVNLSTARAIERTKEVGIRKSLGAGKKGISVQFILEAITTCVVALLFSYILTVGIFDRFSSLVGKQLSINSLINPTTIIFTLLLAIVIGVIAGIYPSLFISRLKPIEILKGRMIYRSDGLGVRKLLLSIQFIVAGIMIFGSITVNQQIQFIQNKELGFENDQLLVLELNTEEERTRLESIKNEINKIDGVLGSGGISNLPGSQFNQNAVFQSARPEISASFSQMGTDFDALQLLGVQLNNGRWFDKSNPVDTSLTNFIFNQTAVQALGLSDSVFEIPLTWDTEVTPQEGRVVGVVDDFHFKSLHKAVQPLIILASPRSSNYLLVKLEARKNPIEIIDQIKEVHKIFDPVFDLEHYFLDELVDSQYKADQQTLSVLQIFSGIALFLSALGLLGLAYLNITHKTREIGIRKVLGANIGQLVAKENLAFIKVVAVSLFIGLPVSFFVMTEWLNRFEYRNTNFMLPATFTVIILVLITIVCVSLAILRTTTQNPTKAIKHE